MQGYSTHFFYGADPDHFGFGKFCKIVGIDHHHTSRDFNDEKYYDGSWGIYDHQFLPFAGRMLQKEDAAYIHEPLIIINYGNLQVTSYSFNNPHIQIPEILYIAKTYGLGNMKSSIVVYDGFWRMMRNLGIRTNADFNRYVADMEIPDVLKNIVMCQSYIPKRLLKIGVISKLAMAVSYIL